MKICKSVDSCKQVESLRSREWADDAQFARAVEIMCLKCKVGK